MSDNATQQWQRADRPWSDYPLGSKARESWSGGHWIKTERGWKWHCGSTFGRPGAADEVMLPEGWCMLSFVPKYHRQIVSGELAGGWISIPLPGLVDIAWAECFRESERIQQEGGTIIILDPKGDATQIEPMRELLMSLNTGVKLVMLNEVARATDVATGPMVMILNGATGAGKTGTIKSLIAAGAKIQYLIPKDTKQKFSLDLIDWDALDCDLNDGVAIDEFMAWDWGDPSVLTNLEAEMAGRNKKLILIAQYRGDIDESLLVSKPLVVTIHGRHTKVEVTFDERGLHFPASNRTVAQRIVDTLQVRDSGAYPADYDAQMVADNEEIERRYQSLRGQMSFAEADRAARVEFVERMLASNCFMVE